MKSLVEKLHAGQGGVVSTISPPLLTIEYNSRPELMTEYTDREWIVKVLETAMLHDRHDIAVYDGSTVVGIASLTVSEDDIHRRSVSHITSCLVHPDYRRRGVFRLMFRLMRETTEGKYIAITQRINSDEYKTRYREVTHGKHI